VGGEVTYGMVTNDIDPHRGQMPSMLTETATVRVMLKSPSGALF
jgi:hypothetical protein